MTRPEIQSADCPRCGYSLRGQVALWTDLCPLVGRCTECGLELRWRDVVNPSYAVPRWYLESASPKRLIPAAMQTLVAGLLPWWFWKRIGMQVKARTSRLVVMLLVLVSLGWTILAIDAAWQTRRIILSTRWIPVDARARITNALLNPLSSEPAMGQSALWTMSPMDLGRLNWPMLLLGALVFCLPAMVGLMFVVLPSSRRMAKIRAGHILRVSLLGVAINAFFVLSVSVAYRPIAFQMQMNDVLRQALLYSAFIGFGLFQIGYWDAAVRCYLRLPSPMAVSLLLNVAGVLLWGVIGASIMALFTL